MRQLLPLLACPAMMIAMMIMMRRRPHQPEDPETTRLREEAAALRRALSEPDQASDTAKP